MRRFLRNDAVFNKVLNPLLQRSARLLRNVGGLFLPDLCPGCDRPLLRHELGLCKRCQDDLPLTRALDDPRNSVASLFLGRVRLENAAALMRFDRGGKVQRILHRLKYQGDTNAGMALGRLLGTALEESERFRTVDTVMAVPLHASKERVRGYNQAQVIVDGLVEVFPLRTVRKELLRVVKTPTQTHKGRVERWRNVKEAFHLAHPEVLTGAHLLLVDDVVTTGATLEGCARALETVPGIRLSVLAVACA
jgi:ComF family protein